MLTADLNWLISQARKSLASRGADYLPTAPVHRLPCEILLTASRKRPRTGQLTVRCRCMAQTRHAPSAAYYNYDPIGEAGSIREAVALWRTHRAGGVDTPPSVT